MFRKVGCLVLLGILIFIFIGGGYFINRFNNRFFGKPSAHAKFEYGDIVLPFTWGKSKNGDYIEEHSSILVPIFFEGIEKKLFLQFDTGSPYTYFHENALGSFVGENFTYNEVVKKKDHLVEEMEIHFEGSSMQASGLKLSKGYGFTLDEMTDGRYSVGTIGMDFFGTRTVEIDFEKQEIRAYESRPEYPGSTFEAFDYRGRRLMLPATIKKKKYDFCYDSGSSAFGLMTTKQRYNRHRDKSAKVHDFSANRHGSGIPIIHTYSNDILSIGGVDLTLMRVSYVDMYANIQFLISPFTKIGGWLGNKPFLNATLVLDLDKEEFTVLKNDPGP